MSPGLSFRFGDSPGDRLSIQDDLSFSCQRSLCFLSSQGQQSTSSSSSSLSSSSSSCLSSPHSSSSSPFFEVELQLDGSGVRLYPSIDEIQTAINQSALAILSCSKNVDSWTSKSLLLDGLLEGGAGGGPEEETLLNVGGGVEQGQGGGG